MGHISEHHDYVVIAYANGQQASAIATELQQRGVKTTRQRVQAYAKEHGIARACKVCRCPLPYLPCKQVFCPSCRDIASHHDVIVQMYSVERLSAGNIAARLVTLGCNVSADAVRLYAQERQITRSCSHCRQPLEPMAMGNKIYCDTCAPSRDDVGMLQRYDLSRPEFDALVAGQDDRCKLCRELLSEVPKVCVDHDHKTDKVRGILCQSCNQCVGFLEKMLANGLHSRMLEYVGRRVEKSD